MWLFISLATSITQSSRDLISKHLSSKATAIGSAFAGFLIPLPFYFLGALIVGFEGISYTVLGYAISRGILDFFADTSKMKSYQLAPISLVSPFGSFTLVFVSLFSAIFLGEIPSFITFVGIGIIAISTFFITTNQNNSFHHLSSKEKNGIMWSIIASVFFASMMVLDRASMQTSKQFTYLFLITFISTLTYIPFLIIKKTPFLKEMKTNSNTFAKRSAIEMLFDYLRVSAMNLANAPIVSSVMRVSMVFSIIGGKIFFHEKVSSKQIILSIVSLFGVLLIALG